MKKICDNIDFIRNSLKTAEKIAENVEIIAVTKTFPASDVAQALKCGIKHIGESKIQEALPKFAELGSALEGITKHFIGHLQSNKAKKAVENFDLIHSLDSLDLAKDIDRHAKNAGKIQQCLIEVKVSDEITKAGAKVSEVPEFYSQCLNFPNISIKGLMTITPLGAQPEDSRIYFRQVATLFEELRAKYGRKEFVILSMGMSDDYLTAVEEGSNMVRIGSAIFGERDYGNS